MSEIIAKKEIVGKDSNGEKKEFHFAIERPYCLEDLSWACVVHGIGSKPHRVVGMDAWQALTLSISLIEQILAYFIEDGGKLYWLETGENMELSELIPRFKPNAT